MRATTLMIVMAAAGLSAVTPASAETMNFKAAISAQEEVPPTGTQGTGSLTASYDSLTKLLSYKVEYSGLTGPALMAHFHGPAPKGKNADVMIPVSGSLASPIKGTATLTDDQAKALTGGQLYFNVHTAAHKGGEVRGQVTSGM